MQNLFSYFSKTLKFLFNMHNSVPKLACPPSVRCMKNLERSAFSRDISVVVLKVENKVLSAVQKFIKKYFIKLDSFKPVRIEDDKSKGFYLDPDKVSQFDDIEPSDKLSLKKLNIDEKDFLLKSVNINYENWKCEQIFKAVLPENVETVSGYTQIGHIIHLNLRDHLLEYKQLIGDVLLDKTKSCRTVVNKTNIIDNTYRNFSMELLAGDEDYFVTVKENNCNFQFDFSKVYWNSRLHREHERVINLLDTGDVLFDVFAGVGPFSIPAAKKKCKVFANDLNPDSHKWLVHNSHKNKIKEDYFKPYNLDGSEFIRAVIREELNKIIDGKNEMSPSNKIHITMNLPALAVTFLPHFKGLLPSQNLTMNSNIYIHVYCFVNGELDHDKLALKLVNDSLGSNIKENIYEIFNVRNVAPAKEMMRVSFELTSDILFDVKSSKRELDVCEATSKKLCTEINI